MKEEEREREQWKSKSIGFYLFVRYRIRPSPPLPEDSNPIDFFPSLSFVNPGGNDTGLDVAPFLHAAVIPFLRMWISKSGLECLLRIKNCVGLLQLGVCPLEILRDVCL